MRNNKRTMRQNLTESAEPAGRFIYFNGKFQILSRQISHFVMGTGKKLVHSLILDMANTAAQLWMIMFLGSTHTHRSVNAKGLALEGKHVLKVASLFRPLLSATEEQPRSGKPRSQSCTTDCIMNLSRRQRRLLVNVCVHAAAKKATKKNQLPRRFVWACAVITIDES